MNLTKSALDLYCRGANISNVGQPLMNYWVKETWSPPWIEPIRSRDIGRRVVHAKHVLFAGDSTTRDTFYQFVNVAGYHIFNNFATTSKITYPPNPMGRDVFGSCIGNAERNIACKRDLNRSEDSVHFRFTMRGDSRFELDAVPRGITHAYVQCPVYEWLNPHAYNYSVKRENRAHVAVSEKVFVSSVVRACGIYIDEIRKLNPRAAIHLLGIASFPGWMRSQINPDHLMHEINSKFGVLCENNHY